MNTDSTKHPEIVLYPKPTGVLGLATAFVQSWRLGVTTEKYLSPRRDSMVKTPEPDESSKLRYPLGIGNPLM